MLLSSLSGEEIKVLQKLLKIGTIDVIGGAPILIRDRSSLRVPFGTGASCAKIQADDLENYGLYPDTNYDACGAVFRSLFANEPLACSLAPWYGERAQHVATSLNRSLRMDSWQQHREKMKLSGQILSGAFHRHFDGLSVVKALHILADAGLAKRPWRATLEASEQWQHLRTATLQEVLGEVRHFAKTTIPRQHELFSKTPPLRTSVV